MPKDRDVRALARIRKRNSAADAGIAAGDQRASLMESHEYLRVDKDCYGAPALRLSATRRHCGGNRRDRQHSGANFDKTVVSPLQSKASCSGYRAAAMNLLDPSLYTGVRRPLIEAEGLPPACYYDEAFYRREVDTVFAGSWVMVGRTERIPNKGDYFTTEFAGMRLIVVRDHDEIRAHGNSCRHRGSRLLEGEGNCRAIICPYHAWSYSLDGSLRAAPGMDQSVGFKTDEYSLVALRVSVWGGFIFVCRDANAPSLLDYIGDLADVLAPYRFGDMRSGRRVEFDVACNWKAWVENFMEGYHIPTVHRRTISKFKAVNVPQQRGRGQYDLIWERHPGTLALLGDDAGFPPIESLTGDTVEGSRFALIYPNSMIAMTIDAMWSFECHPMGPERSRVVLTSCFPNTRFERPDFASISANYYKRQDIVIEEDNAISVVQQQGLRSTLARPGRVSYKEPIVHSLDNWVLDRVIGPAPSPVSSPVSIPVSIPVSVAQLPVMRS